MECFARANNRLITVHLVMKSLCRVNAARPAICPHLPRESGWRGWSSGKVGPVGSVLGEGWDQGVLRPPPAMPPWAMGLEPPGAKAPQLCTTAHCPAPLSVPPLSSPSAWSSRCKPPMRFSFLPPKPVRLEWREEGVGRTQTTAPPPHPPCSPGHMRVSLSWQGSSGPPHVRNKAI